MYSTERLRNVIREDLGNARDMRMDDAPVAVLITAKRLRDGKPWYFVRSSPRNSGRTGHLRLADCITASTAEPTYFAPYVIPEEGSRPAAQPIGALVDDTPAGLPEPVTLVGRYGRVEKLAAGHAATLWKAVNGHDAIWTYMSRYGPFADAARERMVLRASKSRR